MINIILFIIITYTYIHDINVFSQAFSMFLLIQEIIPEKFIKIGYHNIYIFFISYNIDIYHDIYLPLMGKEILSTCLLDFENEGKHNMFTI